MSSSPRRLGFDGEGHDGRGRDNLVIDDRRFFHADGIAGARLLQFGNGGDIAGNYHIGRFLRLAVEKENFPNRSVIFREALINCRRQTVKVPE